MDQFHKYGYYTYDGRSYFDKFDAFDAAVARQDWGAQLDFIWPKQDAFDWTAEPEETLSELYAARARDIRERYDYVILMYSGGTDSHQMLWTHLNRGIHLDEVCHVQPLGFIERLPPLASPDSPLALLHEYRLAALPGLREVERSCPNTNVRIIDTTWGYLNPEVWRAAPHGARVSGGTHGLYHAIRRTCEGMELQRIARRLGGRRIAVLHGNEKPFMRLIGDELFLFFSDSARYGVEQLWQHNGAARYEPVVFFSGEPRIVCKQAHTIRRFLENNPTSVVNIRERHITVSVDNDIPGLTVNTIYPDWDGCFQKSRKRSDGAILPAMLGDGIKDVAAERDRYYNERYGQLDAVKHIISDGNSSVRLNDTLTKLYKIGTV